MSVDRRGVAHPTSTMAEQGLDEYGELRTLRELLARLVSWVRDGHPAEFGPHGFVPLAALLHSK